MSFNQAGTVLIFLTAAFFIGDIQAKDEFTELKNNGIHTFQNRFDSEQSLNTPVRHGFLTAIDLRPPRSSLAPIVEDFWRDAPTQKWRAKKALTSVSYQLYPVSFEERVMYYDPNQQAVVQDYPGLSLSNKQYWQMLYVGHGYHLIKSYYDGRCLETRGPGQPVGVSECNSGPKQQWAIVQL